MLAEIHLLSKQMFIKHYHILAAVLGAGDKAVKKTENTYARWRIYI